VVAVAAPVVAVAVPAPVVAVAAPVVAVAVAAPVVAVAAPVVAVAVPAPVVAVAAPVVAVGAVVAVEPPGDVATVVIVARWSSGAAGTASGFSQR
jgi:hypothetical protein